MQSKFDSTCCDCGAKINAGERIRYLGRSKAECHRCMPAENGNAQNANAAASTDWSSALAWDDHDPVPGQSIGAHNSTPVAEIIKPKKAAEVVHLPPTAAAVEYAEKVIDENAAEQALADQAIANAAEFTQSERAEGMACELIVVLVNAIDVAGVTGRATIAEYCRENSQRPQSGRRSNIWHGIAQAITRA